MKPKFSFVDISKLDHLSLSASSILIFDEVGETIGFVLTEIGARGESLAATELAGPGVQR